MLAANLVPSSTATSIGSSVTFNVVLPGLPALIAYTYTLDKGDGLPVSNCSTLPTSTGGVWTATTSPGWSLAATTLSGVSAAYATPGLKSVVLRVYEAATCPVGATPLVAAGPVAVGTTNIRVRVTAAYLYKHSSRACCNSRCLVHDMVFLYTCCYLITALC